MSSLDLEPVPIKPTSRSFPSEASTYGLARSDDGHNNKTCLKMVYCFSLEHVMYLWEYTIVFSLQFEIVRLVLNRNERKGGGQQ